jgi:putative NADH-flavin reductase
MMNISVFGGTGPTGLVPIEKALLSGHRVTLYARTPVKVSMRHDNLIILKGELSDLDKSKRL